MADDGATLKIRVPGFPEPISFGDWVHDRKFSTCLMVHGQSTPADVFASGPGQPIQGGSRPMSTADSNLDRAGSAGLMPGTEGLVYAIKISQRCLGYNVTATAGVLTDSRVPAQLAALYDLEDKIFFEFKYALKPRTGGKISRYPQGGGIHLVTTNTDTELAQNGVPSPRDQVAFVMPLWMKPNIAFSGVLTPAVALTQNWGYTYAGVAVTQNYTEIMVELEGLFQKPVN